jgi:hypothetical protein
MTAEVQTNRAAAQLREAVRDLAKLACAARPGGAEVIGAWAELARDLADRYYMHLDGLDAQKGLRYVAVARSLDVRPYAVITSDLRELLQALGCAEVTAMAPPAARPFR